MHDQLNDYFDKILWKYQCGFRKGFRTQHSLLDMIKNLWKRLNSGRALAALLTDLTKAFDCLPDDLLIAKRVRLNNTYSEWIDILFGMPQGSILSCLLFNIFLCYLFLILHYIPVANYMDDNTPYCSGLKI